MHRIRVINIKGTREAKEMQMLKVNGITKSVDRAFRAGHSSPYLWQSDSLAMKREPHCCSDGVGRAKRSSCGYRNSNFEYLETVRSQVCLDVRCNANIH